MMRVAFPVPRMLHKADRLRIFARDQGRCQCGRTDCAMTRVAPYDRIDLGAVVADLRAARARDDEGASLRLMIGWLRARRFDPAEPLWQVDHVIPLWAGGSNDDSNLRLLAAPCHRRITAEQTGQRARSGRRKLASVVRRPCIDGDFADGRCTGCGGEFMVHRPVARRALVRAVTGRQRVQTVRRGFRPSWCCSGAGRAPRRERRPGVAGRMVVCRVCGAHDAGVDARGRVGPHRPRGHSEQIRHRLLARVVRGFRDE